MNPITNIMSTALEVLGNNAINRLKKQSLNAEKINFDLLFKMLNDNKDTELGRKYHFADIKTIEDYKKMVPPMGYEDYAPLIERVIDHGETNLYTVYNVKTYALSSGSVGVPKRIPVTDISLEKYTLYGAYRPFATVANAYKGRSQKIKHGRGLNAFDVVSTPTKDGKTLSGCVSGSAADTAKPVMPFILSTPVDVVYPPEKMDTKYLDVLFALRDEKLSYMLGVFMTGIVDEMAYIKDNWESLCDDIEKGIINPETKISSEMKAKLEKQMKPLPKRAAFLREEFKKGFDDPWLRRIWPDLSWAGAIGTGGFKAYTEKFKQLAGDDIPIDFMIYGASEGMFAAALEANAEEYMLIPDGGFYEFVPEDIDDYSVTYTLDQLEVGKKYELLVTNLSGFYRYKLKDVIEVMGYYNEAPLIRFAYRKNQLINLAGEKITENDLAWAVSEFAKDTKIKVVDYCVYGDTDFPPGRYQVIIEPEDKPDLSKSEEYSKLIDEKLGIANEGGYKYERDEGCLAPALLLFSQPQTNALYRDLMVYRGGSVNQIKPARVIDNPIKEKIFLNMIEK